MVLLSHAVALPRKPPPKSPPSWQGMLLYRQIQSGDPSIINRYSTVTLVNNFALHPVDTSVRKRWSKVGNLPLRYLQEKKIWTCPLHFTTRRIDFCHKLSFIYTLNISPGRQSKFPGIIFTQLSSHNESHILLSRLEKQYHC